MAPEIIATCLSNREKYLLLSIHEQPKAVEHLPEEKKLLQLGLAKKEPKPKGIISFWRKRKLTITEKGISVLAAPEI